ncbi:hypothetical protein [Phenylobacterium sp.]|uniref:hypothetical protein n=1 Tax=Phenylobacterium sp. TaxID=1871053 RepID=UPI00272F00F9|nr:hypothetical protein [Phenylobacterium sp.]MDP2214938.1 hypothetical protein [Phenylobacterium sp.]
MNEVRAFVGHSFSDEDDSVVTTFTRYFDQISSLYPAFSWDHATSSEPIDVREKVLAKLEGKNTFIGICTRKEQILQPSLTKKVPFSKFIITEEEGFAWKTSDWIIQEIGLAVGRGLSIILLIESGVRNPGAIQGNIEYIQFERDSPEKSFGKLIEMIKSISPNPRSSGSISAEPSPLEKVEMVDLPKRQEPRQSEEPTNDWQMDDYDREHILRLISDDLSGAEAIDRAFLSSAHGVDPSERAAWAARREWIRLLLVKDGSLERLKDLALEHSGNAQVQNALGNALQHASQHMSAAQAFELAAASSNDRPTKIKSLCDAANCYTDAREFSEAANCISHALNDLKNGDHQKVIVLDAIKYLAETSDNITMETFALQALSDAQPYDTELKFKLAYKYSEFGHEVLALKNYASIHAPVRDASSWNNLGVSYEHFGFPILSIEAYRTSAKLGNTLAMSNIANRYLGVGFIDDARREVEIALKVDGYHENVAKSLASISEASASETERLNKQLEGAAELEKNFRSIASGLACVSIDISGIWESPLCSLTLSSDGYRFSARGTYNFVNYLLAARTDKQDSQQFYIEYTGVRIGAAIFGHVVRRRAEDGYATSILGGAPESDDFVALVGTTSIAVTEKPSSSTPTRYDLKKQF